MRHVRRRAISLFLLCSIGIGLLISPKQIKAKAATTYVTRAKMIRMILNELGIVTQETDTSNYITQAMEIGLITAKSFSDFERPISKTETAVLLVRADEYLYGKTVDDSLVDKIIECRISDISKIREVHRPYLAKAYALGYIMGSSNGTYSTNRKFNPTNKITQKYADTLVSLIHNNENRHQISPDGQLIRTTKLPKMAEFYPYILASYPNSYYDWQFLFMRTKIGDELVYGTDKWVSKVNYAAPVDFGDYKNGEKVFYYYYGREKLTAKELLNECIDSWGKNAQNYLECVFNFDYKTTTKDKAWMEKLLSADFNGVNDKEQTSKLIEEYFEAAIKNQTIVESKIIAVDCSTLYISNGCLYLRAYVRYRVNSSKSMETVKKSPIIFTRFWYPEFKDLQVGKWRDCYVNIEVSSGVPNYGIESLCLNDFIYDNEVLLK